MVLKTMLTVLMLLAFAGLTGRAGAAAQTANTMPAPAESAGPKATIADVRWLVGSWTGTGLGGVSEEVWAEPADGAMMGMFRLVTKDKVTFYEYMNMREEDGSLVLKLKHFNADLTAWEEKERWVTFRLVRVAPGELSFGGLTFRKVGDSGLQIFLALRANGVVREEEFVLRRR